MKVYMNKPRYNWISPYTVKEKFFFWKKDYDAHKNEPPKWLTKLCEGWLKIANFVNRDINYVKIDRWDAWSFQHTLAPIILPMLKELKRVKHGAGYVSDEDVPYGLRSFNAPPKENDWDTDDFHFMRHDWLLDELIWTFEQLHPYNDWESLYHWGEHDIKWVPCSDREGFCTMEFGPNHTAGWDQEAWRNHQDRIDNGCRLFGKYFQGLWD